MGHDLTSVCLRIASGSFELSRLFRILEDSARVSGRVKELDRIFFFFFFVDF